MRVSSSAMGGTGTLWQQARQHGGSFSTARGLQRFQHDLARTHSLLEQRGVARHLADDVDSAGGHDPAGSLTGVSPKKMQNALPGGQ